MGTVLEALGIGFNNIYPVIFNSKLDINQTHGF